MSSQVRSDLIWSGHDRSKPGQSIVKSGQIRSKSVRSDKVKVWSRSGRGYVSSGQEQLKLKIRSAQISQVSSGQAWSGQIRTRLVRTSQVKARSGQFMVRSSSGQGQISSRQVISYYLSVRSCNVMSSQVKLRSRSCQVWSGQVRSAQVRSRSG